MSLTNKYKKTIEFLSLENINLQDFEPKKNEESSFEKLIVQNCPTTLNAFENIMEWPFTRQVDEVSVPCMEIYFQIYEKLNPIIVQQIELLSTKFKTEKSLLISFESTLSNHRCIFWRMKDQKYFYNLICDYPGCSQNEIEVLGVFLCDFLTSCMKTNHLGEFIKKFPFLRKIIFI
jgi:hypothetical protein